MRKCSSHLQLLSALLAAAYFSLWGWFHSPPTAFLSRYLTTLASPTSQGLQGNPGLTFTASHYVLPRSPCRHTLDTCLASVPFLSRGGRVQDFFFASPMLKSEPRDQICQVLLLVGAGSWGPPFNSHFINHDTATAWLAEHALRELFPVLSLWS